MKKKIAFYTMGCKLNYAETSTIARNFSKKKYQHVYFYQYADIYIINSCSVTNNAENKLRKIVGKIIKTNYNAFIIAMGCYVQLNKKKVSNINGISLVLNNIDKFNVHNIILRKFSNLKNQNTFFPAFSFGERRTRSFLKIQDGCNYKCSYCSIPISRGRSKSDTIENILKNIEFLIKQGIKEIVLTGVNIGYFQQEQNDNNLLLLIKSIENYVKKKCRIRLSSIEPNLLTKEHIKFLSKSQCFVPHFHIPLQSGCNKILGKMKRRYVRELYQDKIEYIRNLMPDAYIGSDIIVGFPGETYKNFLDTYDFLKKIDISSIHVFTYSSRPFTIASKNCLNFVSNKIKKKRNNIISNLSKFKYYNFCKKQMLSKKTVLIEKFSKNSLYLYGYTENYIRTKINIKYFINTNTLQKVILKYIDKDGIINAEPCEIVM